MWKEKDSIAWVMAIITFTYFIWDKVRSWVDMGIDISQLRWILPGTVIITIFSISIAIILIRECRNKKKEESPFERLSSAIYGYGYKLHEDKKDRALLELRNGFSIMLHKLGFHETRVKLGGLALDSSTILNDDATKAEILVDDLGWANYLIGNREPAIENINQGIEIARKPSQPLDSRDSRRLSLCRAKGLRHLAIIMREEDPCKSDQNLDDSMKILDSLNDPSSKEIKREIAQIYHAKALVIAMDLGINKSGTITEKYIEGINQVKKSLEILKKSESIFKEIEDVDRYVKDLLLEKRLLESIRMDNEARYVKIILDREKWTTIWPENIEYLL